MLYSDLANLYECKNGSKEINQIVRRNIDIFSIKFCFQLKNDEYSFLRSQIVTLSSKDNCNGRRNKYKFQKD